MAWALLAGCRAALRIGLGHPAVPELVVWRTAVLAAFWLPTGALFFAVAAAPTWRGRWWVVATGVAIAAGLEPLWARRVLEVAWPDPLIGWAAWVIDRLDLNLFTGLAAVGLGCFQRWGRERIRLDQRCHDREQALRVAEIGYLNAQLQPHFLFNALTAAAELVRQGGGRARRFLVALDGVFQRASESGTRTESTIAEEVNSLRGYLAVQQERFGDRFSARIDVAADTLALAIPTLLLQPLAENAVRHGVERVAGPVELSLRIERVADRVRVRMTNPASPATGRGRGIGLDNVERRLAQLYGASARASLQVGAGLAVASLEFPAGTPGFADLVQASTEPAGAEVIGGPRSGRFWIGVVVAVWMAVGALWAFSIQVHRWVTGIRGGSAVPGVWIEAASYAVVTLIGAVAVRWLADRGVPVVVRSGLILGLAGAVAAAAAFLTVALTGPVGPGRAWAMANWAEQRFIVLASIGVASHGWLEWHRRAVVAATATRLAAEAVRVRFATLRWRLQPALVREALAVAATHAERAPDQAERVVLDLAGLLREVLTGPTLGWTQFNLETRQANRLLAMRASLRGHPILLEFWCRTPEVIVPRGVLAALAGHVQQGPDGPVERVEVDWMSTEGRWRFHGSPETRRAVASAIEAVSVGRVVECDGCVVLALDSLPAGDVDAGTLVVEAV